MGRVNESSGRSDAETMVQPVTPTGSPDANNDDKPTGVQGECADHRATEDEANRRRQARIIRALSVASAFNCTGWFMMIPVRSTSDSLGLSGTSFHGHTELCQIGTRVMLLASCVECRKCAHGCERACACRFRLCAASHMVCSYVLMTFYVLCM